LVLWAVGKRFAALGNALRFQVSEGFPVRACCNGLP
jgi:hypothetical protein